MLVAVTMQIGAIAKHLLHLGPISRVRDDFTNQGRFHESGPISRISADRKLRTKLNRCQIHISLQNGFLRVRYVV
jgi:hypothetical protein